LTGGEAALRHFIHRRSTSSNENELRFTENMTDHQGT
jgi:hypothetical protein